MKGLCSMLFLPLNTVLFLLAGALFCADEFSRNDFPLSPDFVFGAGTSAYQYEAATSEDGRTPSIWDTFIQDGYMNGDVAADGYHKYKQDIQLMVETGLEAYRFSIAWSRLIPNGRGPVNPRGLEYYNNVINELVKYGIEPHVTMVHFDLPQALEDEYGGWLSRKMVEDFTVYADVCFREFGDRVKHWSTFNEANIFVPFGYDVGLLPPGRCSYLFGCRKGNSSTEPYIAMHNLLLGHASAARLYQKVYQNDQHGFIGINLHSFGVVPYKDRKEDMLATKRFSAFLHGWILNPLVYGDYPEIMKKRVGSRLPPFTKQESKEIIGSYDFIGFNYYLPTTIKAAANNSKTSNWIFHTDIGVELFDETIDGSTFEYPETSSGLLDFLAYVKQQYGNPPIYIHENGQRMKKDGTLNDTSRVKYLHNYIGTLLDAVRNGVNAKGYFCWSFVDLMEVNTGYNASFGLYYVDLDDKNLKRYPKQSAHWYTNFLKGKKMTANIVFETEWKLQNGVADSQSMDSLASS